MLWQKKQKCAIKQEYIIEVDFHFYKSIISWVWFSRFNSSSFIRWLWFKTQRLTTTKCGCNVFNAMPNIQQVNIFIELKLTTFLLMLAMLQLKLCQIQHALAVGESVETASNGKSKDAILNRLKKCQISKDPPVARTAGQHIEKSARQQIHVAANQNLLTLYVEHQDKIHNLLY